jgi:hypothetical protein
MFEFARSSWGVVQAVPHELLVVLAAVLLAAVARSSWGHKRPGKGERGLSLLEALVLMLLAAVVLLGVIVLT